MDEMIKKSTLFAQILLLALMSCSDNGGSSNDDREHNLIIEVPVPDQEYINDKDNDISWIIDDRCLKYLSCYRWLPERGKIDYYENSNNDITIRKEQVTSTDQRFMIYMGDTLIYSEIDVDTFNYKVALKENVIILAKYPLFSFGCLISAIDIHAKDIIWQSRLIGVFGVAHSVYGNTLYLDIENDIVVVTGRESAGDYIECIDAITGKTLGHRIFRHSKKDYLFRLIDYYDYGKNRKEIKLKESDWKRK